MTRSAPAAFSRAVFGYVASVAILFVLWEYFSRQAVVAMLFPSPQSTWHVAVKLWEEGRLATDIALSLRRIAIGFALGSAAGILLGVLMGSFRSARAFFDPYLQFFRFLPALAWIPAAMLWLGTGEASKIALLIYTTVFVVALNTMIGVASVGRNQVRAAQCFGATRWQIFRMVTIPSTVGHMLTGMRLAMGNCFSTIVAAELLAPKAGLGYLIFSSRTWMQTEFAFVGIAVLGVLGFIIDRVFHLTTTRVYARYLPTAYR
ncbi:MAG TPA: ABC transporter permease [Casimicrobiaceae bacterium]|nr:ABC transporter permease [Casimicrobiaceae bacterium]